MRTFLALLILLLFFSFTIFAQEDKPKQENGSGSGIGSGNGKKIDLKFSDEKAEIEPLKTLSKAPVKYTNSAREKGTEGEVLLKVTFLASGEIGSVTVIKGLPDGLTEQAIIAAKQMKFKPAAKNGVPYSVTKIVRFSFQLIDDKSNDLIDEKAKVVMEKAVAKLGGDKYLNVKTSIGEGRFSLLKDGRIASFQSFTDVIVYPDKERTDFTDNGSKTVQVNTGDAGWIYEEFLEKFGDQSENQIENFKQSMRTHYDYLLRGKWKGEAELSYVGRRPSTLGKRNDVLKLTFEKGFQVEYEFDDEGLPMKTVYLRMNADNQAITEENRYARFISYQGILMPSIIDHFTNGEHTFRIAYESLEFNRNIPDEIFIKPDNPKKLKKKLKL